MAEVTQLEYEKALNLLSKVKSAKEAVEAYENQIRWKEDPVSKIMEESKAEFVAGETVRGTDLLWRATKLRYIHEKGTVERVIAYSSDGDSKNLIAISSDKKIMI
jgi:hypothetical protein